MMIITLVVILALLFILHYYDTDNEVYGHIVSKNTSEVKISRIQEWTNEREDTIIKFAYKPDRPIIDTFTELIFSVQNLTTGEHIKDYLTRVVVTNGQRLFKFENISVSNGDFSVKYLFPDDGTHQVITRIYNKKNPINLGIGSFSVFVPHQSPPDILNPFPTSPSNDGGGNRILSGNIPLVMLAIGAGAVISLLYILKSKKSR